MDTPRLPGITEMTGRLEIRVFGGEGVLLSLSDPKRLCETLAPLDGARKQPRALWESQLFRKACNCSVPGFNRDAYPDHDSGH